VVTRLRSRSKPENHHYRNALQSRIRTGSSCEKISSEPGTGVPTLAGSKRRGPCKRSSSPASAAASRSLRAKCAARRMGGHRAGRAACHATTSGVLQVVAEPPLVSRCLDLGVAPRTWRIVQLLSVAAYMITYLRGPETEAGKRAGTCPSPRGAITVEPGPSLSSRPRQQQKSRPGRRSIELSHHLRRALRRRGPRRTRAAPRVREFPRPTRG